MNVWLVARREYLEHVRTRSFLLGILFTPIMIGLFIGLTDLMEYLARREGKPFVVVDLSVPPAGSRTFATPPGVELGRRLADRWDPEARWALEQVLRPEAGDGTDAILEGLSTRAREGEIAGFAVLRGDLVAGDGRMQWYTRNIANDDLKKLVAQTLREVVRDDRYAWHGVTPEQLVAIQAPVLDPRDVDLSGRTSGDEGAREAGRFIPMIFVYALLIGISTQMQSLLTSTIEEKSNKLVEVLLSSISPFELMSGKILGMLGVTFTLMATWTVGGFYLVQNKGWEHLVPGSVFAWFLAYLVVAILFYSSFIAAIGSAVTELKEAQNMMLPVWVMLMIPLFLMFFVGTHPDSKWVVVLTYFPFFTPFLMINRLSSVVPPGAVEVALSLVLMAVASVASVLLAGRVFRVGILLYGKPATPRELWRWMRTT